MVEVVTVVVVGITAVRDGRRRRPSTQVGGW